MTIKIELNLKKIQVQNQTQSLTFQIPNPDLVQAKIESKLARIKKKSGKNPKLFFFKNFLSTTP